MIECASFHSFLNVLCTKDLLLQGAEADDSRMDDCI